MSDHFRFIAGVYDRLLGPARTKRLLRLLDLPAQGLLLDAGGGTGRASLELRPLVNQVVISDVSLPMLRQAAEKNSLLTVCGVAENLPLADESVDRILVVDALHHFCDQRASVIDLVRVLKKGGRIVIEEPDYDLFIVKMVALAEKIVLMKSHFYRPEAIQKMLEEHSLRTFIERDGRFASWIVADKL